MSLANYKPRSHFFRNKRNWLAALAWVERERERLREYSLADCGGVGEPGGLRAVSEQVAGPAEAVQMRGGDCQRAAQVRQVFAGKNGAP